MSHSVNLPPTGAVQSRMLLDPALEVLTRCRTDQVVITSMGAAHQWPRLSQHPLDFHYIPSAMGQVTSLALGVALAQPHRQVIALAGDGSLLMNLGSLVTIAASGANNLTVVLLDNGVYEVTGGQATAGAVAGCDFAALARAAGIPHVLAFDDLAVWQQQAAAALADAGPRLIALRVEPVRQGYELRAPGPMPQRLAQFRAALAQP